MRYRSKRYKAVRLKIMVSFAIIIALLFFIDSRVRPTITKMAAYSVNVYATKIINEAVLGELSQENLSYSDMIFLNKDADGTVTALETDTVRINLLQANLMNTVIGALQLKEYQEMKIPVGTLLGGHLISGRGFPVTIRMIPAGSVNSEITHKFESAGINQTRLQLMLKISVPISAIIPGYQSSVTVTTDVCLAETVIVGKVPESFTDVNGDNSPLISKINDYSGK